MYFKQPFKLFQAVTDTIVQSSIDQDRLLLWFDRTVDNAQTTCFTMFYNEVLILTGGTIGFRIVIFNKWLWTRAIGTLTDTISELCIETDE